MLKIRNPELYRREDKRPIRSSREADALWRQNKKAQVNPVPVREKIIYIEDYFVR